MQSKLRIRWSQQSSYPGLRKDGSLLATLSGRDRRAYISNSEDTEL